MDARLHHIVTQQTRLFHARGFVGRCRTICDPEVAEALKRLRIGEESGLANLYQYLVGPFASTGPRRLPQLLDIIAEDRNIVSFSEKFWSDSGSSHSILAISEIDTMVGLFYNVETDAVYEVELDLEWEGFLSGKLDPTWPNSVDFLVDYFGTKAEQSGEL